MALGKQDGWMDAHTHGPGPDDTSDAQKNHTESTHGRKESCVPLARLPLTLITATSACNSAISVHNGGMNGDP